MPKGKQELEAACSARLPALKSLIVLDHSGKALFSYGRQSKSSKQVASMLFKHASPDFEQAILYYRDRLVLAMRLKKGYLMATFPRKVNIARNLLRLREIGEKVWG